MSGNTGVAGSPLGALFHCSSSIAISGAIGRASFDHLPWLGWNVARPGNLFCGFRFGNDPLEEADRGTVCGGYELHLIENPADEWQPVSSQATFFRCLGNFGFRAESDTPVSDQEGEKKHINGGVAAYRARAGPVSVLKDVSKYLIAG
jgi:hypothetical protein